MHNYILRSTKYAAFYRRYYTGKPAKKYDAVVVGGGHNGLVAAAYLAKSGKKVCVLERRKCVGGAAVTEEIVPGFKFSRASYVLSLLRPQIYRDLDLKVLNLTKYGLKYFVRNPNSYTPLKKSMWTSATKSLTLGMDTELNRQEISKFSKKDALNYDVYEKKLAKLVECFEPLMDVSLYSLNKLLASETSLINKFKLLAKNSDLRKLVSGLLKLGPSFPFAYEMMTTPPVDLMNKWFECDVLKASILTDACIGSFQSPATIGSSYILLHHVMGGVDDLKGAWVYPQGGMGSVSEAIARCASAYGAEIFTNKHVSEIKLYNDGTVKGVLTADNELIESTIVLSNATPKITCLDLLSTGVLDSEYLQEIEEIDYSSPATKINVALKELPNFESDPNIFPNSAMPHHRCTIHLNCESMSCILEAHKEGMEGLLPQRPMIEMTLPSSLDSSLCSEDGNHVCLIFCQYTNYTLKNGKQWDEKTKKQFAKQIFDNINEYAPGFNDIIIDYEVLPPPELEKIFGLTGGNIFHGNLSLDQILFNRPVSSTKYYPPYTPIKGLYLCGSGAHPGGGVTGAPGRLCALEILARYE